MAWYNHILPKKSNGTVQNASEPSDSITVISGDNTGMFNLFGQPYITPDQSLELSVVFACVDKIAGTVSTAPVKVYKRDGERNIYKPSHSLSKILRTRPNKTMTASTFWKNMIIDKVLRGDCYAQIVRNNLNDIVSLNWLRASSMSVYYGWEVDASKLGMKDDDLLYHYADDSGNYHWLRSYEVLHIPNINFDGKHGMSCIKAGNNAITLAKDAESSASGIFKRGLQASTAISYESNMPEDVRKRFKEELKKKYTGVGNFHTPLILSHGGKIQQMSLTAEDAQLLDSRKYSVIDICRFFGIPPVLIGETEKTSSWGSGVEQMGRWFVTFTMNSHFVAFEQEMENKLFKGGNHYASFDETFITRGDSKSRAEYYKAAVGGTQNPGWMSVEEVRVREGLSPTPDIGELVKMPEKVEANKDVDE